MTGVHSNETRETQEKLLVEEIGDSEGDLLLLLAGVRAIVKLAEGWKW